MSDLWWGLGMLAVGMGVVFALLALLMLILVLIGKLDRTPTPPAVEPAPSVPELAPSDKPAPAVRVYADGLDDNKLAAIAVAVLTHAEIRRRSAAPEVRAYEPGSQLFASRWVSIGRGNQQAPFRKR